LCGPLLFEEFVAAERQAGRFRLPLAAMPGQTALLHGHCHQKAFGTAAAAAEALRLIPDLKVETFDSTCCGMAGSFGLEAEHYDVSMQIGELGVLPKMRAAAPETLLAACGHSCRHQIAEGAGRQARHIVRILDEASSEPLSRPLPPPPPPPPRGGGGGRGGAAGEGGEHRNAMGG